MDFLFLETYAVTYGVHAIVLSVLICVFRLILLVSLKDKISGVTRSYIEMAFAIIAEFFYVLIFFRNASAFTLKSVSSALLSYSLSLAIYSLTQRIFRGKTVKIDAKTLIIESILCDYVAKENLSSVSKAVAEAIENEANKDQLLLLLKEKVSTPKDDEEIIALVDLILSSVKNVK